MSSFDLDLIRQFIRIYEEGSLTRAAARMHMTQPSMSYALARLRTQLDDPLFERTGEGMTPTPRAMILYPVFKETLESLDEAALTGEFVPSRSKETFRLALTDVGEFFFLARIVEVLGRLAPDVVLDVVPLDITLIEKWLQGGVVDAAISSVNSRPPNVQEHLLRDRYVCLLPTRLAPPGTHLTFAQLSALRHVGIDRSAGHFQVDDAFEKAGIYRHIPLRLQHFSTLGRIVDNGGLAAIVPNWLAVVFARNWNVTSRELPFELDAFDINITYRPLTPSSHARRWFIKTIIDVIRSTPAELELPIDVMVR